MTKKNKESLCKRCGICCHGKALINGIVHIFLNQPCMFLKKDKEGKYYCEVYKDRHNYEEYGVKCLTLEEGIEKNVFPNDCGYKELFPKDYKEVRIVNSIRDISWKLQDKDIRALSEIG